MCVRSLNTGALAFEVTSLLFPRQVLEPSPQTFSRLSKMNALAVLPSRQLPQHKILHLCTERPSSDVFEGDLT